MVATMQLSDRIGRRMKLQDLHVLMTVVQAGTMGKAAELLNITQPAISRSIAELEHALGVRLLDRHHRGVEPTTYGRALLDGGALVFDDLRQTVKNIEFLTDPTAGSVRIGCNPFLTATFVSAVVDRFSRRYPRIVFDVLAREAETLHRELSERSVDLLIARKYGPLADDQLGFEMLYDDAFVVVAGANNPWVRRRKVELADLVKEPWVLPRPATALGSVFAEAFRASGLDGPRTTVFTNHAEMRTNLLTTGRFLTIFSTSVLKFPAGRPELKVLPIELPLARVPVGIVTLKNRTLSPVVQLFIDCTREVAKPMAKHRR
jgi:DNA-binding transcriptional LysR family regulator